MDMVKRSDVTVMFNGKLSVHSRDCMLIHPVVFVPNVQGGWIFPDVAPAAEVILIGHGDGHGSDDEPGDTVVIVLLWRVQKQTLL